MKKITVCLVLVLALVSCKKEAEVKDYATLSGKITNPISDSIRITAGANKIIKLNEDGTFKDTMKVSFNTVFLMDKKNSLFLHLDNGDDLHLSYDAANMDETLSFTGTNAIANNYLVAKNKLQLEKISNQYGKLTNPELTQEQFDEQMAAAQQPILELLENTKGLDTAFIAKEKEHIAKVKDRHQKDYSDRVALKKMNGTESPKFVDYENYDGTKTSLDDFKGKYVYIDLWATWCGPCKKEIPFLKEVEKAYHDKNIAFVSISMDRKNAYNTWRKMIEEKEMTGVQLYSNEDKEFPLAYNVTGIPRFILIDPQGVIIDSYAPNPSSPELKVLLDKLLG